jgi:sugar phosphate permease
MTADTAKLQGWRRHVFLAAWILYAGYYSCRKDIVSHNTGATQLALTLACFAATYTIGQIVGGTLADFVGARRVALAGAGLSIICTGQLAWNTSPGLSLALQLGNGLGQGFGWPSLLKLIGCWFHRGERDRLLGWWSTSYILGGLLATSLTAWLIVQTGTRERSGINTIYLVSSGALFCSALLFYRVTLHLPDAGPFIHDHEPSASKLRSSFEGWRAITGNHNLRMIAGAYFFLKMTRYTLLFWLPRYLTSGMSQTLPGAEHFANYFELFGFLGPIATGYALEKWFGEKRMRLGAGLLFGLAFLCLLHPMLADGGWLAMCISISLMGILIYGADILISGMAVLDAVAEPLLGRASGLVNGAGSIGQGFSPFLITIFVSHFGWTRLFDLFVAFAIISGTLCAFGARSPQQTSDLNRSVLEPSH